MTNERNNFRNVLWELVYDYVSKLIKINESRKDPSQKGQINEEIIIDVLKKFLPSKYKISQRCNIINMNGDLSAEQDITIWDCINYSNGFEEFKVLQLESIALIIDAKKTLDATKLGKSFKQIEKFREDMRIKVPGSDVYKPLINPPLYFIFSIDGEWKKLSTLKNAIESKIMENNIQPINRFDYLHIMRKGITVGWLTPFELRNPNRTKLPEFFAKRELIDFMPVNLPYRRYIKFFPSKLDNSYGHEENYAMSFVLSRYKDSEIGQNFDNLEDVSLNNQIESLVLFISVVCRALEEQSAMPVHAMIRRSYINSDPLIESMISDPF